MSEAWSHIRVLGRVRPLLQHELATNEKAIVSALAQDSLSVFYNEQMQKYKFHRCFGESVDQDDLFEQSGVKEMIDMALTGFRASCFAYGQTGSGKTYTMFGDETKGTGKVGLIPRSLRYLFDVLPPDGSVSVRMSFIELYNEQVFDLLNSNRTNLKIRWTKDEGYFAENAFVVACDTVADAMEVLTEGRHNRQVGSHDLNRDSSRSHALLSVFVEQLDPTHECAVSTGRVTFVDLAGSERLRDTNSDGVTVTEAQSINKSLFALGAVISALSTAARKGRAPKNVPYRDSKLTKLLMDCLSGTAIGMLLACVSPAERFAEESTRTLEYALRAQNISSKPLQNVDQSSLMVRDLQQANAQLKARVRDLELQLLMAGITPDSAESRASSARGVGSAYSSGSNPPSLNASLPANAEGPAHKPPSPSVYGGRRMELPPLGLPGSKDSSLSPVEFFGTPTSLASNSPMVASPAVPVQRAKGQPASRSARPLSVRVLKQKAVAGHVHPFSAGAGTSRYGDNATKDELIGALDRVTDENAELTRAVQDLHVQMSQYGSPSRDRDGSSARRPNVVTNGDLAAFFNPVKSTESGSPARASGIPKPRPKG
ncbi:Kinesin motor domain [Carpediemonas membranifera]|uniref:Kinesin-like protein n=1 Tax=Carpediemonas membranifera TaxID=201153 RepID=A0A8J6AUB4_9EUKA|nr:Kinesin motor domain [Carpediemonas membranifera]|eukprot:KAG9392675.1 Kinesin motor domain [Carpediemonas membranifera]